MENYSVELPKCGISLKKYKFMEPNQIYSNLSKRRDVFPWDNSGQARCFTVKMVAFLAWWNARSEVWFDLVWFFLKYIEAWSIILDFFDQAFHLQNQLLRLFTDFLSLIFLQSAICYRTPLSDFCIVHSQSSFFYFSYNWIPFSLLKILPARSSSQVHSLLDSTAKPRITLGLVKWASTFQSSNAFTGNTKKN